MNTTVSDIQRDLRDLWASMAHKAQTGEGYAVTRSCVFNLVVYASGEGSEREIIQITSEVTEQHPGRIIALLPGSPESDVQAWVNAQCHFAAGKRSQICSEQVMIRAGTASLERLSSFVLPLLISDLPVFVWWRDPVDVQSKLFQDLAEVADRVLFDSLRIKPETFGSLFRFIRENQEWTAFSDFAWARLTSWRHAIAQLYDCSAWRPVFEKITSLEFQVAGPSNRISTALLSGWLASRLGWRPTKNDWEFETGHGRFMVRVNSVESQQHSDLISVKLSSQDPALDLLISKGDDPSRLQAYVASDGSKQPAGVTRIDPDQEANLLEAELEILGHDRIFEGALALAESLLIEKS